MADLRVIPRHDRNLGPDRPRPSCLAGMRGGVVERAIRPDQHREQVVEAEWSRDSLVPPTRYLFYKRSMSWSGPRRPEDASRVE